jgi:phospholipase C
MADPIKHVVVLMLENNSFDRMLGCMSEVFPDLDGARLAPDPAFANPDYPDTKHTLAQLPIAERVVPVDPGHDLDDVIRQVNGGDCQGFVADFAQHAPRAPNEEREQIMAYFKMGDLPVLHALAKEFKICDHWFSSVPGPTWPNRLFVHSGTSKGHVDMPAGIFHPDVHIYDQPTVYQRMCEKNVSWSIYYGDVPQSLLLVKQLEYPTHYRRMEYFASDAEGPEEEFPKYAFIEPAYFGAAQNDQHPPTDVMHGEMLIANVYNAIRKNEELWASSLLVVLYDEHGGFFDHVPPPSTVAPDENTKQFSFTELGLRVPALLVSPWVDPGICSTQLDHTSLLRYATDKWALGPLGNRVPQAESFAGSIARNSARTDCPPSLVVPVAQANALNTPLNAHQAALAGFTEHLEVLHTKALDSEIAEHVRAMKGPLQNQSAVVSERIEKYFAARSRGFPS